MPVSVRYLVDDVGAAVAFYTELLGFEVRMQPPGAGFAALERGELRLLLNEPGAGGAGQATPRGVPEPGGWNRFQLEVEDLDAVMLELRDRGISLEGEIVTGRGGRQILVADPADNLVELFEPRQS